MRSKLSFAYTSSRIRTVDTAPRSPVASFYGNLPAGETVYDLSAQNHRLSLYLWNGGRLNSEPGDILEVELYDASLDPVQRQIFYPSRGYIIPVPANVQSLKIINPALIPVPVEMEVF